LDSIPFNGVITVMFPLEETDEVIF
jgi:hypothetical protein